MAGIYNQLEDDIWNAQYTGTFQVKIPKSNFIKTVLDNQIYVIYAIMKKRIQILTKVCTKSANWELNMVLTKIVSISTVRRCSTGNDFLKLLC